MTEGNVVAVDRRDRVAVVTLDEPRRRNAITLRMRDELVAAFDELERDDGVGAVVVTGAGSAFCAGADLGDLANAGPDDFRAIYEAFLRVARSRLPTVAAVNGPAVGAGLNLALACDVRVAGLSARFIARFLDLGLHPGGGNTWMLRHLVGPQTAAAILLFGAEFGGAEAVAAGLALKAMDDDALLDEAVALAARAAAAPRDLAARLKQTLRSGYAVDDLDAAVDLELDAQVWSSRQPFFTRR